MGNSVRRRIPGLAGRGLLLVHFSALALAAAAPGCSSEVADCEPVDDDNPCTEDLCSNGAPVSEDAAAGTACDVDGGAVCDGEGSCVACLSSSDCPDGLVCDAANACVAATCTDGALNGAETDVDCGGADCPSCPPGASCDGPDDCADGVCEGGVCVAGACGDGVPNGDEECDDSNTTDGDGCSGECLNELCGDGTVNAEGSEECDDGNTNDGDGCNARCVAEVCGDGVENNDGAEECDDGGTEAGDGCSAECVLEICGDGLVNNDGTEECDDGGTEAGDGCDATCVLELCGDGVVNNDGTEECDDGGTEAGDGCNAECVLEFCGDGIVNDDGAEECDDGGADAGDGCGETCAIEFCGDGIVNNNGNEACDTGGNVNGCSDGCELDADNDGLPDQWDPFPTDATLPGKATANLVYAHTSSRLYTVNPTDYTVTDLGQFTFDQSPGQVTDIAISRRGVVFAVTFADLFVCNPSNAACFYLADLPSSFNGLTMVPPGTLHPSEDTLVGIANSGAWFSISITGTTAVLTEIGAYGAGQTNAGDVVSIQNVGTYGAVNRPGVNTGNVIVECDPLTGAVLGDVVTTTGYTTLYGIAATEDRVFGFNSGGQILEINPATNSFTVVANTNLTWWGAGAFSVIVP